MITKLYIIINKQTEEVKAISEYEWMANEYVKQCREKYDIIETTNQKSIALLTEYNKDDLFLYTFKDIVINRKEYDFISNCITQEYSRIKNMIKDIKAIVNNCNLPESHINHLKKTRKLLKSYIEKDNIFDVFNLRDCILEIQEDRRLQDTIDRLNDLDEEYYNKIER